MRSSTSRVAAVAFVWGTFATTAPPSSLDQRIIREERDNAQSAAVRSPVPHKRTGDNTGNR